MLIIFRPETEDSLELRIYDTQQNRCFHTADDMIIVNCEDIAARLDDFVGLSKRKKQKLVIHDLIGNDQTQALITAFQTYED